jgi:hypothetical protein
MGHELSHELSHGTSIRKLWPGDVQGHAGMRTATWTRIRIEAALALTTAAEEPQVAVTSSRTAVVGRFDPITAGPHGSTWWRVKDSNLRSFRDGFTVPRLQARDQQKCLTSNNFRAYSPQTADVGQGQPDTSEARERRNSHVQGVHRFGLRKRHRGRTHGDARSGGVPLASPHGCDLSTPASTHILRVPHPVVNDGHLGVLRTEPRLPSAATFGF